MYLCSKCGHSSHPGQSRIIRYSYREVIDKVTRKIRKEIAGESYLCHECASGRTREVVCNHVNHTPPVIEQVENTLPPVQPKPSPLPEGQKKRVEYNYKRLKIVAHEVKATKSVKSPKPTSAKKRK